MSDTFIIKNRLAFRLAKYTVFIAFLIGFVIGTAQVIEDFQGQDTELDETIDKILEVSKPPAIRAVHTLDQALAQEVVYGLIQYPFIVNARITDELGEVLAEQDATLRNTQTKWITAAISGDQKQYLLDLKAPEYANIEPGQLLVVIDKDQALQPFYDRALAILLSGIVRNVLLAIFMIAIFHFVLTKPLALLAKQFFELDPTKNRGDGFSVPDEHKETELGLLCSSGNEFVETVQQLLVENRENHHALERSENSLKQLINQVPQLILAVNATGDILFCNRKFADFYGCKIDEIAGLQLLQLHDFDHEVEELNQIRRSVEANQTEEAVTDFIWSNQTGKKLHFSITAAPFVYFSEPATLFVATDISEQKMVQDHISYMANHDTLTGLPNRALLNDRLEQALATSKRSGDLNALMFIDLDHFKNINDSLGHGVGDLLLKKVAEILSNEVRSCDTVARLGGDEFVVLLQAFNADVEKVTKDVEIVCNKLLAILSQPIEVKQHQLRIGASIGVVLFPIAGTSLDDLMRFADTAMYHAKENGRNGFAFYHQAMSLAVEKQQNMETQLHQAIEEKQFCVHYQPLVNVGGQITGFEALIRWQHPEKGLVSPAEFIPSLEVSGLIVPVSNWLLGQCSRQIAAWRASGFWQADWYVSVNISPLQFYQADMIPAMKSAIAEGGANLTDICLEITETVAIENIEFAVNRLKAIRELGMQIALDDFGTGYSSLSYLKDLPIDIVKIDRSFVQELGQKSKSQSIVEAVANIARAYDLKVVAEGIETHDQLMLAHNIGCHIFQGFFIARPQVADNLKQTYLTRNVDS